MGRTIKNLAVAHEAATKHRDQLEQADDAVAAFFTSTPFIVGVVTVVFVLPLIEAVLKKLGLPGISDGVYWIGRVIASGTYWIGNKVYRAFDFLRDFFRDYLEHMYNVLVALLSLVWNPTYAFFAGVAGSVAELYDSLSEYIAKWTTVIPSDKPKKRDPAERAAYQRDIVATLHREGINVTEEDLRKSPRAFRRTARSATSAPASASTDDSE
jgi:hypothetical protein